MGDRFLPQHDDLGILINKHATELHTRLVSLNVDALGLPDHCLYYFKTSHFNRLYFSIETSAHLLYRSISIVKKSPAELVIMDYGAGVGTLYMLAKMIGCKKVIYNDFLEEWKFSALQIAEAINIHIDEYIVGDIDDTMTDLRSKQIECDIITSRNVIEHVYDLACFYRAIRENQPNALVYSSTTANLYNPAVHIKHVLWHRKWEKEYYKRRLEIIGSGDIQDVSKQQLLARKTQGLARHDLAAAIQQYVTSGILPDPSMHYTNCCQPDTGVWAEHMISFARYRKFIEDAGYKTLFLPGFWDTHYSSGLKNIMANVFNKLIRALGNTGIVLSPFIYVIAQPRLKHFSSKQ